LATIAAPQLRLDAKHYQEDFLKARARVVASGFPVRLVRDVAGAAVPGRTKLVTVSNATAGAGYLEAHEAFLLRPETGRYVARAATPDYESYLLRPGMILTPSSGRNLGPLAYVGKNLAGFAMTDIIRLAPFVPDDGLYLLAYLLTPTGQALLRRGRTGTTVDHLSANDAGDIPVAWVDREARSKIVDRMRKAEGALDAGRLALDEAELELHSLLGLPPQPTPGKYLAAAGARAFSMRTADLSLRLDVAYYDPQVRECRRQISERGGGRLAAAAELVMLGRYKRYYVPAGHGLPIMSGRQTLQMRPVNLQYISGRSFSDPGAFVLGRGWSTFTCDGRAEEGLGSPGFVFVTRTGWMASNHVMRAIPRSGVHPGYLYLALRSRYVQIQLKAAATGSVIDALDPAAAGDVVIPRLSGADERRLGAIAATAWDGIGRAIRLEDAVVRALDAMITNAYESPRHEAMVAH
jgi:hypothetical protein